MRKPVIVLTIIAFIACFLIGLYLAEIVPGKGSITGQSSNQPLSTPASRFQHNILIIHVDDLQAQSPQLVSIWGLIVYFPDPKLIFQRVYPLDMLENDKIEASFALSAGKVPNATFLKTLNKSLNIVWDNYILMDTQAGDHLSAWSGGPVLSGAEAGQEQLITVEGDAVRKLCEKFASQRPGSRDPFDWQSMIPDHFLTNIPFDFGLLSIDRLSQGDTPIKCDIYSD